MQTTREYKDTFISFHLEHTADPQAFFNLSAQEQNPAAWAEGITPNEAALKYFKSGKDITGVMQGYDRKFDLNTFDHATTQKGIVVYLITDALETLDQRALIAFEAELKKNKPNCRLIAMHVEDRDSELRDCEEVKRHSVLGGSIPLIQLSAQKGLEANERGKDALLLRFLQEPAVQANLSGSAIRRASARVSNFFSFGKKSSSDVNPEAKAEAATSSRASVGDVEEAGDHELGGRANRGSLVTRPKAFESVYAEKEVKPAKKWAPVNTAAVAALPAVQAAAKKHNVNTERAKEELAGNADNFKATQVGLAGLFGASVKGGSAVAGNGDFLAQREAARVRFEAADSKPTMPAPGK